MQIATEILWRKVHDEIFKKSCAQVDPLEAPPEFPNGASAEPKQKRPNPISVRLSETEKDLIKAKAKQAGCSFRGYIRAAALGSDYKPPVDPKDRQALLMVYRELTAWGNNINQIARHLNAGIAEPIQAAVTIERMREGIFFAIGLARKVLSRGVPEPKL